MCNNISYNNNISINDFKNEIQKQQELIINLTTENDMLKKIITKKGFIQTIT